MKKKSSSLRAWASLRKSLETLGLGWAFHTLSPTLQVARTPDFPRGVEVEHLFPDDYRAFVAELGYPVVGFSYYCQVGLSFLPPAHIETCSPMVGVEGALLRPARKQRPRARAAFFAGTELSDLVGWAFAPGEGGANEVWVVDGSLVEPAGDFDTWATAQATRIEAWARAQTAAQRKALEQENDGEDDPHRALDYALSSDEPHDKATREDRRLHWVCDQSKTPYRHGVIDDEGTWLLEGQPFDAVGPFIRGTARVEREGKILLIDPRGRVVKDLTPAPPKKKKSTLELDGKRVTLVGSFRVLNVSLAEFEERITELGGKFVPPNEVADVYAMSKTTHFPELVEAAKAQQARVPSTQLIPLDTFVKQLGLG